jgi:hypothetical protein
LLLEAIDIHVAQAITAQPQAIPSTSWIGLGALALLLGIAAHRSRLHL